MFTDPSFSTPQGGDLKGVNSQPPGPLPPRPSPPAAPESLRGLRQGARPHPACGAAFSGRTADPNAGRRKPRSHLPPHSPPLPVALAGFLPKTCPKPPQIQGNQAKPPAAHHSTTATTTPTTTARLARSPGAAPTCSPRQSHRARTHQLQQPQRQPPPR